jgi:hypothetical protein
MCASSYNITLHENIEEIQRLRQKKEGEEEEEKLSVQIPSMKLTRAL